MFDDQLNEQNLPPSNLPTEPVDMFADTEKGMSDVSAEQPPNALSAGLLKKKENVPAPTIDVNSGAMNPAPMYAMKEPILGKIILAIVFVAILGGLGFGGWWIYNNYFNQSEVSNTNTQVNTANGTDIVEGLPSEVGTSEEVAPTTTLNENTEVDTASSVPSDVELNRDINNDKILFGEPIDTDKDGLDDVRETEIGTDPAKSDTDSDGLIDGDEVIIWKTDPLKADTDGDTYLDGSEIKNGYNPLGSGKLFGVQTNTSTNTGTSTK